MNSGPKKLAYNSFEPISLYSITNPARNRYTQTRIVNIVITRQKHKMGCSIFTPHFFNQSVFPGFT